MLHPAGRLYLRGQRPARRAFRLMQPPLPPPRRMHAFRLMQPSLRSLRRRMLRAFEVMQPPVPLRPPAPRRRRTAEQRRREGPADSSLETHALPPEAAAALAAQARAAGLTVSVTAARALQTGLSRWQRSAAARRRPARSVRGTRLVLYVPAKVAARAKRAAAATGRTTSALVAAALVAGLRAPAGATAGAAS